MMVQSYLPGGANVPSNEGILAPPAWQIRLKLCFLRPTQVHNPNGKSVGSAVLAGLTTVIDRLTDQATGSETIGRI